MPSGPSAYRRSPPPSCCACPACCACSACCASAALLSPASSGSPSSSASSACRSCGGRKAAIWQQAVRHRCSRHAGLHCGAAADAGCTADAATLRLRLAAARAVPSTTRDAKPPISQPNAIPQHLQQPPPLRTCSAWPSGCCAAPGGGRLSCPAGSPPSSRPPPRPSYCCRRSSLMEAPRRCRK